MEHEGRDERQAVSRIESEARRAKDFASTDIKSLRDLIQSLQGDVTGFRDSQIIQKGSVDSVQTAQRQYQEQQRQSNNQIAELVLANQQLLRRLESLEQSSKDNDTTLEALKRVDDLEKRLMKTQASTNEIKQSFEDLRVTADQDKKQFEQDMIKSTRSFEQLIQRRDEDLRSVQENVSSLKDSLGRWQKRDADAAIALDKLAQDIETTQRTFSSTLSALESKIARVEDSSLAEINRVVDATKQDLSELSKKFKEVTSWQEETSRKLLMVQGAVDKEASQSDRRLSQVEKELFPLGTIEDLRRSRLEGIEESLTNIRSGLDALQHELVSVSESVTTVSTDVETVRNKASVDFIHQQSINEKNSQVAATVSELEDKVLRVQEQALMLEDTVSMMKTPAKVPEPVAVTVPVPSISELSNDNIEDHEEELPSSFIIDLPQGPAIPPPPAPSVTPQVEEVHEHDELVADDVVPRRGSRPLSAKRFSSIRGDEGKLSLPSSPEVVSDDSEATVEEIFHDSSDESGDAEDITFPSTTTLVHEVPVSHIHLSPRGGVAAHLPAHLPSITGHVPAGHVDEGLRRSTLLPSLSNPAKTLSIGIITTPAKAPSGSFSGASSPNRQRSNSSNLKSPLFSSNSYDDYLDERELISPMNSSSAKASHLGPVVVSASLDAGIDRHDDREVVAVDDEGDIRVENEPFISFRRTSSPSSTNNIIASITQSLDDFDNSFDESEGDDEPGPMITASSYSRRRSLDQVPFQPAKASHVSNQAEEKKFLLDRSDLTGFTRAKAPTVASSSLTSPK